MTHPLIDRLTSELGWPRLETMADVALFTNAPGLHVAFVPGDPARNLESADVAIILPELHMAFQRQFDCAVIALAIEEELRNTTRVLKTPSLMFYREGRLIGDIQKVRNWDDYVTRVTEILATPVAA